MIKLIGILLILIGFTLKLDTIAVVLIAGLVTGIASSMDITEVLNILGSSFVENRYVTLLLLTLPTIGILERNGLRERAGKCIRALKGATTGKVLSLYLVIRAILAAMSISLGGHVQIIRPIIYPMAKGASETEKELTKKLDEELKGRANSMENFGNFFGQNIFIASPGVLLILGTMKSAGVAVDAYDVAKASIPMAFIVILLVGIRNFIFDKKIAKEMGKGE